MISILIQVAQTAFFALLALKWGWGWWVVFFVLRAVWILVDFLTCYVSAIVLGAASRMQTGNDLGEQIEKTRVKGWGAVRAFGIFYFNLMKRGQAVFFFL